MALHAMAFLCKGNTEELNIIFVDGSPSRDTLIEREFDLLGIRYVHCGRELSFGETYNTGIKEASNPVVVLLANDIFIEAKQIEALALEIRNGVGCAMPYLSFSDYGAQTARKLPAPRRFFPTRMTLNVNAFSRKALENVGLIPEEMTGCYNDIILYIRLREKGYSIIIRNVGNVFHMAQQTLKTNSTNISYEKDERLFSIKYPEYWHRGHVTLSKVAQRCATRQVYRIAEYLSGFGYSASLWHAIWAIEPYICAEKGTIKEALSRLLRGFYSLSKKRGR